MQFLYRAAATAEKTIEGKPINDTAASKPAIKQVNLRSNGENTIRGEVKVICSRVRPTGVQAYVDNTTILPNGSIKGVITHNLIPGEYTTIGNERINCT